MQEAAWDCIWPISIQISIDDERKCVWDKPEQNIQNERTLVWGNLTPSQIAFYLNVNQKRRHNLGEAWIRIYPISIQLSIKKEIGLGQLET